MVSSVFAVVVLGAIFWSSSWRKTDDIGQFSSLTATISLPERRLLPDDSIVELKEGAQIDVDYSGAFRRVMLRQGEAHFQVAKNKARPFIVEAAGVKVRAVGTAFSVQLDPLKQVEVLVTEGQVQVAPLPETTSVATDPDFKGTLPTADTPGSASAQPIMRAGYRATISLTKAPPQMVEVSAAELAERLSWRVPSLEFSRTPLDEVVALMNRYAAPNQKVQFVIADHELSGVKLTGYLQTDNSEGLVRLLESNFGVKTERSGEKIILRRRR